MNVQGSVVLAACIYGAFTAGAPAGAASAAASRRESPGKTFNEAAARAIGPDPAVIEAGGADSSDTEEIAASTLVARWDGVRWTPAGEPSDGSATLWAITATAARRVRVLRS